MQSEFKIQQFWLSSVTEDSRLKISSSFMWQQPCVPEIMYFFLWKSMSPQNMGMRRSQRNSFSVLIPINSSQKMLHASKFPGFRQVVSAKNQHSWGSSVLSADPHGAAGSAHAAVLQRGRWHPGWELLSSLQHSCPAAGTGPSAESAAPPLQKKRSHE